MSKVAAIVGFCLVTLLITSSAGSAQTRKGPPRAAKFDQFEQLGHCDLGARLDNFAIQLQNEPRAKGAIVTYAPEGEGHGTGKQVLEIIKDYLVNSRGIAPDRIETIYGGRNLNLYQSHTELWVVPHGAPLPKTVKYESKVESFQGLYIDEIRQDDFRFEFTEEDMGPGIGNSSDASFADILHQQKNAVAYVVVYDGEDLTPGAWRRLGQSDIDKFKEFNVEPSRFKLILGGHKSLTHIQYWIFPDTAPPPMPDVGSERAFAKTLKAGDFNVYDLTEKNQASIYSRLSEILTLDKTVRAFLVVRLEEPEPEEATPTEPVEESSPPVDLAKLVEKWRVDLANTHKIGPDRLIIVFSSEPSLPGLSLWFVPKGAPLPDPKEDEIVEP